MSPVNRAPDGALQPPSSSSSSRGNSPTAATDWPPFRSPAPPPRPPYPFSYRPSLPPRPPLGHPLGLRPPLPPALLPPFAPAFIPPPPQLLFAAFCRMMAARSPSPPLPHGMVLPPAFGRSPSPTLFGGSPPLPPLSPDNAQGDRSLASPPLQPSVAGANPFIVVAAAAAAQNQQSANRKSQQPKPRKGRITVAELMGRNPPPAMPKRDVPMTSQDERFRNRPRSSNSVGTVLPPSRMQQQQMSNQQQRAAAGGGTAPTPPRQIRGQKQPIFQPYLTQNAVEEGLERGTLTKGALRVNQRNYEESFVDNPATGDQDIMVYGLKDRNRVLHGDIVVVRVKNRRNWIVQENLYRAYKEGKEVARQPLKVEVKAIATTSCNKQPKKDGPRGFGDLPSQKQQVPSELESPPLGGRSGSVSPTTTKDCKTKGDDTKGTVCVVMDLQEGVSSEIDVAISQSQQTSATNSSLVYPRSKMVRIWQKVDHLHGAAQGNKGVVESAVVSRLDDLGISRQPTASNRHVEAILKNRRIRGTSVSEDHEHAVWDRTVVGESVGPQPSTASRQAVAHGEPQHQQAAGSRSKKFKTPNDFPGETIPDECLQKTGEVVGVLERKHSRAAVGCLKPMSDANRNYALFSPTDSRMPRMVIPAKELPEGFFSRPQDFAKFIFMARMTDWPPTEHFALGRLQRNLGLAGELEPETEGLLCQYDVDTREFSQACINSLQQFGITEGNSESWKIPETEFKYRRDFRDETVFTIDPTTARDLDDALHIKPVGNDEYEVGVHIADVSYFIKHESELDRWAAKRATSTYLVHKVVPMLPRVLCEELCSLNPGVDRLSFSVVWRMTKDGHVKDEWFGRSIIRSVIKLAYDHAQGFIDNPDREWTKEELPTIYGDTTSKRISEDVLLLHSLASQIRKRRFDNGALRIDLPKLTFSLDQETQLPVGCAVYQQRDSNRLIEEYMLMANMAVARRIYEHHPKTAVLRRHPSPNPKILKETMQLCERLGYPVEGMSSGNMQFSLSKYADSDEKSQAILAVLNQFCMKPMRLAQYFCTGTIEDEFDYRHYALNVPFYTHFTSPIRRYPDVMVHRLLAASLEYAPPPALEPNVVEALTTHSNDRKLAAKTVSELSAEMCFAVFVKDCGPIDERAVVLNVLDHSFDVLLLRFGLVKRVYTNKLHLAPHRAPVYEEGPPPTLQLFWPAKSGVGVRTQVIGICQVVDCVLTGLPEPLKFMATIKPPKADNE